MSGSEPKLRDATTADAAGCLAIYAPIVERTTISFELEPPTLEDFADRIARALVRHAWIVAVRGDGGDEQVVGYAYATTFRARAAYDRTCETSVYVAASERGRGTGRDLMEALIERLCARGFAQAVAGATLPNPASAALHAAVGFRPVGHFAGVGHKFGAWHDVGFWQRSLDPDGPPTATDRPEPGPDPAS